MNIITNTSQNDTFTPCSFVINKTSTQVSIPTKSNYPYSINKWCINKILSPLIKIII